LRKQLYNWGTRQSLTPESLHREPPLELTKDVIGPDLVGDRPT
jgi:hypothetical protein